MAESTHIEWTDATWNPITGCSVVSPGCTNCYAMRLAGTRLRDHPSRQGLTWPRKSGPVWTGEVRLNEDWLNQPLTWRQPRKIFVNAHGDLFHEGVPREWIDQIFARMALTPHHTYQVLTKRADRMRAYCNGRDTPGRIYDIVMDQAINHGADVVLMLPGIDPAHAPKGRKVFLGRWPLPNVWMGVSVEDQIRTDERVPILLDTYATVRWISAEPLLGPVNPFTSCCTWQATRAWPERSHISLGSRLIDWVVVGGESGLGARPMHPDWARQIRDDCAAAGVPFFFKQYGDWREVGHDMGETIRVDADSAEAQAWLASVEARTAFVARDGRVFRSVDELPDETPCRLVERLGKRRAGRTLDGVIHDAMPDIAA